MADGRAYHWLGDTGPDDTVGAPQWLLDLVLPPVHTHHAGDWHYEAGSNDRYVNRAMESELSELAGTPPGNRGYQLNASAFALGQLVGAGAIHRSEAEHGLYAGAVTCGVAQADGERETWAKIRRGLDAGEKQPRHIPTPQAENDNTRLVDIKKMLERAREKAAKKAAKGPADDEPEVAVEPTPAPADPTLPVTEDDTPFRFTPFSWKDPASLPRREFAFGKHYIRKYVSVTVAPGGLGKTSNSVVEALSMASGRDLTGDKPPKRLKVWLFNAEDPRDEMDRRIMAACLHYGLSPADIEGHLFLDTGREQELIVMHEDRKAGVTVNVPIVEAVAEQIRRNKVDVLIVDPFVSTHRVNENDNGAIDKVAKLWAQIADDTNCAIDVVHHLRKLADREATVEDARGAISLIGAARSVRVLNRMSVEDANAAGIDVKDRYSYFHIHYGKQNLTRMDTTQHWRKMVSVGLGNGGKGLLAKTQQDTAGVVTAWKWPTTEEIVSDLTAEQIDNIKSVLRGQAYKAAPQGKPWAGEAIAYVLGEDAADKATRKRVGSLLKALMKEGILEQVEDRDPVSRSAMKVVR
jgi:RecA-family ATPase